MSSWLLDFLDLPDRVSRHVLGSWLSTNDVGRLDSALCNENLRLKFVAILRDPTFVLQNSRTNVRKRATTFIKWVIRRAISVSSIYFPAKVAVSLQERFFARDRQSLKHVQCSYDEDGSDCNAAIIKNIRTHCGNLETIDLRDWMVLTKGMLADIFTSCPKLTAVKIIACPLLEDILQTVAQHLPNLRHLDITNSTLMLKEKTMSDFARACSQLQVFRLGELESLTDAHVQQLVAHCRQLRELSVSRARISNAALQHLAEYCPELERLGLDDCAYISSPGVVALAKACPKLRKVYLNECPRLTDSAVKGLVQHCSNLEVLALSCNAWLTDVCLCAIAEHCPQLMYLHVGSCGGISDRGVVAVASSCPNMKLLRLSTVGAVTNAAVRALGSKALLMRVRMADENDFYEFGAAHGYGGFEDRCKEDSAFNRR